MKKITSSILLHGFLYAVGNSILGGVSAILYQGGIPTKKQLIAVGCVGLGTGITYILKEISPFQLPPQQ